MFHSARIQLTLWYTLIIMLITISISTMFYARTMTVLERQQERFERRFDNEFEVPRRGKPRPPFHLDVEEAQNDLIVQLAKINGVIIFVVAGASYLLSGITLKPIEKAHKEQRRFVSDAAHELKTPLAALKTSQEVNLMDKNLSSDAKHILSENLEDITSLEKLTNSLLRLARVNGQSVSFQNVALQPVIQQAVKQLSPLAKKKHITITVTGSTHSTISGDEGSLIELMVIFLDNAIKYSPKKTKITIQIKRVGKKILVSIQDHGIGIDKHDIKHIFKRFYRADSARSKHAANGYGLGLSVANKIASQHDADIAVESTPGKGTRFDITFPPLS